MNNKEKTALQKEVVDSIEPYTSGRLLLAPRIGKSKLIIDLIKRDKYDSILWVTPSAKLAEEDIPREFEIWKGKRFLKKLTTTTWMGLDNIQGHYDLVVFDEEQFITEANIRPIRMGWLTYNNIISMTGTETRHEDKLALYKELGLKVIYKISINQAVDIGLLSDYSIKVVGVDMSPDKTYKAGTKAKPFLTTEGKNYEYLSKVIDASPGGKDKMFKIFNRMRAVKNSPSKLTAAKYLINTLPGRRLIFSGSIAQAELLSKNTYHSKTNGENLRKFKAGEIDEIAMVNTGGVGETYKAIDHLIMVQTDSDNNGLTSQKICRTLLSQKGYEATIWIICLKQTKDVAWVRSTLQSFDKEKVEYINFKDLKNENSSRT